MGEQSGTYVVTHADEGSAVLQDADSGQVVTLAENPGVDPGEVLVATLSTAEGMSAVWTVDDVEERWTVETGASEEPPTGQAVDAAAELPEGDLERIERAGEGELHVVRVPAELTDQAVEDVLDDEDSLVARAARYGVQRVEVRAEDGVLSVRYLPD